MINGSDLINQPWNTTFSPYIHLFGQGWLLIPISFIGAALFMKTRDPIMLSVYMIITGVLCSAYSFTMFDAFPVAIVPYLLFTVIGIAVLFHGVFYGGR
jgi:hydrogenase/urease accessory protein HupE